MSSLPVIVIGAGGHAKVLLEALLLCNATVLGLTDSDPAKHGSYVLGLPVLGDDSVLKDHHPANIMLVNGIGSVRRPELRREIFEMCRELDLCFQSVVHPSAFVSENALIGEGAQIMAGAVVQSGVVLGEDSIVNTGAVVDHDVVIGKHCHIAPGATLSGLVKLEDEVHVGTGASVIQGISIGKGAVVGAGAAVIADVPADITVAGVPARPI